MTRKRACSQQNTSLTWAAHAWRTYGARTIDPAWGDLKAIAAHCATEEFHIRKITLCVEATWILRRLVKERRPCSVCSSETQGPMAFSASTIRSPSER